MNHGAVRLFQHAKIGPLKEFESIQEKSGWSSNAEISCPDDSVVTAEDVVDNREL